MASEDTIQIAPQILGCPVDSTLTITQVHRDLFKVAGANMMGSKSVNMTRHDLDKLHCSLIRVLDGC